MVGVIAHAGGGIFQDGHEAGAIDRQRAGGLGQAGEFGECGKEVHGLGELAGGGAGARDAGRDHDEGDAVGLLEIGVLGPDAEVAEVPAMVAPEDDDGVVGEFQFVERGHDAADLHVGVTHTRVVTVDELALEVVGVGMHGRLGHGEKRIDLAAAFHGHRHDTVRGGLARGHGELGGIVEVPVFLRHGEGQVRAHEAHGEEEGLGGFFAGGAQARNGVGGDAGVGVGIVGHVGRFPGGAARERAGAGRAAEVVEEGLLIGGRAVARAGGINILDDEIFVHGQAPGGGIVVGAVADVKNFAHGLGAVAVAHEQLRERDGVGVGVAEVAAKLVEPGGGGARAEEQGETGGGADGLVAIRGVEAQAASDEAVEIRRDGGAVAVGAERGLQVIDEDEENVRARGGRRRS